MTETTTLDKLYLEWSQFTTARNNRELEARKAFLTIRRHIAKQQTMSPDDLLKLIDWHVASLAVGGEDR